MRLSAAVRERVEREATKRGLALPGRKRTYKRYQTDPVGYACDVLKLTLTPDQETILETLVDNRRVAVLASHGIGKTFVAAVATCWWYDCWDEHIAYITAPSWKQALGLTFKQIRIIRRLMRMPGQTLRSGVVRDRDPDLEPVHYIQAINADSGEGFQGEHSAPILIVMEEAVGVKSYIWDAADGLMTMPECRMLCICNPTDEATPMGQAAASPIYETISINGLEHVNIQHELRGEVAPYPRAIRLAWVNEMLVTDCDRTDELTGDAFEFPPESGNLYLPNAVFQGRVLGQFPTQADAQVIPSGWLSGLPILRPHGMPCIGVDVARFGSDRTTLAGRQASCLLTLREVRKMDVDAVAGAAIQMARSLAEMCAPVGVDLRAFAKNIPIRVDATGGLGVAPAVFLAKAGYNVIEVNASSKALDEEQYPNKRSELWFVTRERARTKDLDLSRIEPEMRKKLERELSTPTWKPNLRGQKEVEKKDDIKKRLGESPDLADGVNLAFDQTGGDWNAFTAALGNAENNAQAALETDLVSEAATVRW